MSTTEMRVKTIYAKVSASDTHGPLEFAVHLRVIVKDTTFRGALAALTNAIEGEPCEVAEAVSVVGETPPKTGDRIRFTLHRGLGLDAAGRIEADVYVGSGDHLAAAGWLLTALSDVEVISRA